MKAGHKQVHFEVWKNPELSNLTFSRGEYSDFSFTPHFHEYYIIQVVEKGMNEGVCQKKRFEATPGDVLIINPGEIHTGNSFEGKPLQYMGFCPEVEQVKTYLKHLELSDQQIPEFTALQFSDPRLAIKIKALIGASKHTRDRFFLETLTAEILSELLQKHSNLRLSKFSSQREDMTKVELAITFIKEHYNTQFTLKELSRFCNVDPYYLIKLFKKEKGITPYQFLRNYRIELAKKKLKQNIPIVQAALEVGFFDQSHLHRNFKPLTGMTPFQYKRQFHTRMAV